MNDVIVINDVEGKAFESILDKGIHFIDLGNSSLPVFDFPVKVKDGENFCWILNGKFHRLDGLL